MFAAERGLVDVIDYFKTKDVEVDTFYNFFLLKKSLLENWKKAHFIQAAKILDSEFIHNSSAATETMTVLSKLMIDYAPPKHHAMYLKFSKRSTHGASRSTEDNFLALAQFAFVYDSFWQLFIEILRDCCKLDDLIFRSIQRMLETLVKDKRPPQDSQVLKKIMDLYAILKGLLKKHPLKRSDLEVQMKELDVILGNFMESDYMNNEENVLRFVRMKHDGEYVYKNTLVNNSRMFYDGPLAVALDNDIKSFFRASTVEDMLLESFYGFLKLATDEPNKGCWDSHVVELLQHKSQPIRDCHFHLLGIMRLQSDFILGRYSPCVFMLAEGLSKFITLCLVSYLSIKVYSTDIFSTPLTSAADISANSTIAVTIPTSSVVPPTSVEYLLCIQLLAAVLYELGQVSVFNVAMS